MTRIEATSVVASASKQIAALDTESRRAKRVRDAAAARAKARMDKAIQRAKDAYDKALRDVDAKIRSAGEDRAIRREALVRQLTEATALVARAPGSQD